MFTENNVKWFMGGDFTIPETPKNAEQLKALFKNWTAEIDGWGDSSELADIELTECEIVKGQIVITLKDGIAT